MVKTKFGKRISNYTVNELLYVRRIVENYINRASSTLKKLDMLDYSYNKLSDINYLISTRS